MIKRFNLKYLPLIGGIIGVAMGLSYYLSIMISQLFIDRPSSTWILGAYWLPYFLIKPLLIGVLIGIFILIASGIFKKIRLLMQIEKKYFYILIVILIIVSAIGGIVKIILLQTGLISD